MAAGGVRKATFPPVFGMPGREGGGNEGNVVQNTSRRIRSKYIANNNNIMNIKNIKKKRTLYTLPHSPPLNVWLLLSSLPPMPPALPPSPSPI